MHFAVDESIKIYAIEQSKGSSNNAGFMSIKYLKAENLVQILKPKVQELEVYLSRMDLI